MVLLFLLLSAGFGARDAPIPTTLTSSLAPTLTVVPAVIQAGQSVRLTCRVPRQAANRAVIWGFDNWTQSSRSLDGDQAPITWQAHYDQVPCESGQPFCIVVRARPAQDARITASFLVVCN